jgi:hypothetical protein
MASAKITSGKRDNRMEIKETHGICRRGPTLRSIYTNNKCDQDQIDYGYYRHYRGARCDDSGRRAALILKHPQAMRKLNPFSPPKQFL